MRGRRGGWFLLMALVLAICFLVQHASAFPFPQSSSQPYPPSSEDEELQLRSPFKKPNPTANSSSNRRIRGEDKRGAQEIAREKSEMEMNKKLRGLVGAYLPPSEPPSYAGVYVLRFTFGNESNCEADDLCVDVVIDGSNLTIVSLSESWSGNITGDFTEGSATDFLVQGLRQNFSVSCLGYFDEDGVMDLSCEIGDAECTYFFKKVETCAGKSEYWLDHWGWQKVLLVVSCGTVGLAVIIAVLIGIVVVVMRRYKGTGYRPIN